jgi:RNA polymerase sigma factor (sigma-70 family)
MPTKSCRGSDKIHEAAAFAPNAGTPRKIKLTKPALRKTTQIGTARMRVDALPSDVSEEVLLKKYTPLVRRVALALTGMKPTLLGHDDVMQDGMIGLLRAIRSNRTEPGANIRGAIIDGYRAAGNISRVDYAKAKKTRRAVAAGESVTTAEKEASDQVMAMAWMPGLAMGDASEDGLVIRDPFPGPEQRAMANQVLRRVVDVLQHMSVRDRSIFIACELDGDKQVRVAKRFGVSGGRVSQILRAVRLEILRVIA